MITTKLTKLATATDLRYKTKELLSQVTTLKIPLAITKGGTYLAIMVTPEYFEKTSSAYEILTDARDAKDLEREIETTSDTGVDFEMFVAKKFGKDYVQNYIKETSGKVSR